MIDGWKYHYPPIVFSTLWVNMSDLIAEERLIAPEEVLQELEIGGDDLYNWAKSQTTFFKPPLPLIQNSVENILNDFKKFKSKVSVDIWADPYLIAHAIYNNAVIITSETEAGNKAKIIKIPDVCQELGIEYIPLLELFEREKWRF